MPLATPPAAPATASPSLKRAAALMSALGGSLPPGLLDDLPPARRSALEQAAQQLSASPATERRALLRELATGCRGAAGKNDAPAPRIRESRPLPRRAPGEDTSPLVVPAATPLVWMAEAPVETLVEALERERPQVWAAVVACAPPEVAEALVSAMAPQRAQEVTLALTRTGPPAPGALQALDAALAEEVARLQDREARRLEGVRGLARSLARAPRDLAEGALRALEGRDARLAEAVSGLLHLPEESAPTAVTEMAAGMPPAPEAAPHDLVLALERA